jgi:hypothetical protein
MSHKETCMSHCFDYLNQRNLAYVFNMQIFSHYYRKHNGAMGNAYSVGLNAGDLMIETFKLQEVNHEGRNESQKATTV